MGSAHLPTLHRFINRVAAMMTQTPSHLHLLLYSSSSPITPENANRALVEPECIIINHGRCFEANGSETLQRLFHRAI